MIIFLGWRVVPLSQFGQLVTLINMSWIMSDFTVLTGEQATKQSCKTTQGHFI